MREYQSDRRQFNKEIGMSDGSDDDVPYRPRGSSRRKSKKGVSDDEDDDVGYKPRNRRPSKATRNDDDDEDDDVLEKAKARGKEWLRFFKLKTKPVFYWSGATYR